jgi:putative lipoic acid-binding regulatory protein
MIFVAIYLHVVIHTTFEELYRISLPALIQKSEIGCPSARFRVDSPRGTYSSIHVQILQCDFEMFASNIRNCTQHASNALRVCGVVAENSLD